MINILWDIPCIYICISQNLYCEDIPCSRQTENKQKTKTQHLVYRGYTAHIYRGPKAPWAWKRRKSLKMDIPWIYRGGQNGHTVDVSTFLAPGSSEQAPCNSRQLPASSRQAPGKFPSSREAPGDPPQASNTIPTGSRHLPPGSSLRPSMTF